MEPITLLSTLPDLRRVLAQFRQWGLTVELTGPEEDWLEAKVVIAEDFSSPMALTFRRDVGDEAAANWSQKLAEVRETLGRSPADDRKTDVVAFLDRLQSALAIGWEPEMHGGMRPDSRLMLLFAVAREFKGVLFSASWLRDSEGKTLLAADGDWDRDADLPPGSGRLSRQRTRN